MASADMDTRTRGYDRGGGGYVRGRRTWQFFCHARACGHPSPACVMPAHAGIHLVIVTPDSIGGLCLRLSWIPAFAGMTEGGGYVRGRRTWQFFCYARACGHPSPTCVMPAHAGIHHPFLSCPRMRVSIPFSCSLRLDDAPTEPQWGVPGFPAGQRPVCWRHFESALQHRPELYV